MYVLLNLCLFGMNLPWALEIADINCDKFARDGNCVFTRHLLLCLYILFLKVILGMRDLPSLGPHW